MRDALDGTTQHCHSNISHASSLTDQVMGMVISLLGPSLLELGEQTNSPLSSLVYIFSARSIGFFLGTLLGGHLIDKVSEKSMKQCGCEA